MGEFSYVITASQTAAVYAFQFLGRGGERGRFALGDPAVCERVREILRRRFPEE